MPVPPPAPAHAQLAAVQAAQYNAANTNNNYDAGADGFDDGQYDPRYNDPNFEGNLRGASAAYVQQPQPVQPQYVPQPQAQPQPQAYNNVNNVNYIAQYQSTTPHPHRFQPPGQTFNNSPDLINIFFISQSYIISILTNVFFSFALQVNCH